MDEILPIKKRLVERNDQAANALRNQFESARLKVSNWVSSPGTGKTELLEALLRYEREQGKRPAALVGDCATENDAIRLARSGAPVRQIITEGLCHLEANMIESHLAGWNLADFDSLIIENVGNLVCPESFDLGEEIRVALISVTEGEDKPLKYPQIFRSADLVIITKVDLAAAVGWDRQRALAAIREVNPIAPILETSARSGQGLSELAATLG